MAKHPHSTGTGITKKNRVAFDGEDLEPAIKLFFDNWNRLHAEGGGDYGAVTLSLIKQCREILASASEPHDPDSQADFARRILLHHEIAVAEIERGNPDSAARFAFHVGYLLCEAHMKGRWEPDALRGQGVAKGARAAAEKTNALHKNTREKRFALMQDLVPKIGVDKAAVECEFEGLGHRDAVKRQWNRHQKKKRDT